MDTYVMRSPGRDIIDNALVPALRRHRTPQINHAAVHGVLRYVTTASIPPDQRRDATDNP